MDLCPTHINYTRNMKECLQMLLRYFNLWKHVGLMGKSCRPALRLGDFCYRGRSGERQRGHWCLMTLALQRQLRPQDHLQRFDQCLQVFPPDSIHLWFPQKTLFQFKIFFWSGNTNVLNYWGLLNFPKETSEILCAVCNFIATSRTFPHSSSSSSKNKKSGWIYIIIKHSLCSTADTRLNMVIWIYCWDESKGNTTCML